MEKKNTVAIVIRYTRNAEEFAALKHATVGRQCTQTNNAREAFKEKLIRDGYLENNEKVNAR